MICVKQQHVLDKIYYVKKNDVLSAFKKYSPQLVVEFLSQAVQTVPLPATRGQTPRV